MCCVQQQDVRHLSNLNQYTAYVLQQMDNRATDSRPKTAAMRLHTLRAWQAVTDEIARNGQLAHRSATWLEFTQLWYALQEHVAWPAPREPYHAPFGALERCAWDECLCSVHKPAHCKRICKGCERVMYCGERCQRNDWEKGGHKERCQRTA
ncbi:zinc finger MYND domain-containing protein [Phanerochaete sordida]|uniref:Zinc finger MYND domain-containing protein n=1 Tax=Phanerochaete sordida TaxID=48140 RepID=A0A9P3GEJ5_9APHY|nr:zinc finger MYND domain-containing protein [Phanerochaete sordida]